MLVRKKRPGVVVIALAVVLGMAAVLMLSKASLAAPVPVDTQPFTVEGYCDFPVSVQLSGKTNVIELPGPDQLFTAPGQHTTLTNLQEPAKQVTVNSAGPGRVTPRENGGVLVVARGHNILYDPGEGIFLTIGYVRFTIAAGTDVGGDITILESHGRIVDLCQRLA
jgi:hypothetical protein